MQLTKKEVQLLAYFVHRASQVNQELTGFVATQIYWEAGNLLLRQIAGMSQDEIDAFRLNLNALGILPDSSVGKTQ